jgi:hypothetical protein
MAERTEVCESCAFWEEHHGDSMGMGYCRRYAPRSVGTYEHNNEALAMFPSTMAEDWCGEHEGRR